MFLVSSKMLYGAAPGNANVGDFGRGMGDGVEMAVNSMNLTATLKKLCMWEKKLYDEVKVWSISFDKDVFAFYVSIVCSSFNLIVFLYAVYLRVFVFLCV